jgi:hypothetical protein
MDVLRGIVGAVVAWIEEDDVAGDARGRREIRSRRLHLHRFCTLETVGDGLAAGRATRSAEVVNRL